MGSMFLAFGCDEKRRNHPYGEGDVNVSVETKSQSD